MQTSRQYNSCKKTYKTINTVQEIQIQNKHVNMTIENLQIQVGVVDTIMLFIKTTTQLFLSIAEMHL